MQNSIGEKIRNRRIEADITQLQLASKINVSIDTISGLESGRKNSTSVTILQIIGKELGITFEI